MKYLWIKYQSYSVNEAVILSKKYGHQGVSGFVNGVLQIFQGKQRSI